MELKLVKPPTSKIKEHFISQTKISQAIIFYSGNWDGIIENGAQSSKE